MQRSQRTGRFGCSGFRLAAGLVVGVCVATPIAARELSVVVAPRSAPVSAADFELSVGGRAADPLTLEPLAPAPGGRPWQVVIYFDTPLVTPEGLTAAIELLRDRAETLTGLGPVTVVAADPQPRALVEDARHPHELRETLELFADRATLAGELVWRRLRHLEIDRREGPADERSGEAIAREEQLLSRQLAGLDSWTRRRPLGGPGLLILVQDGFDLDFKRFYLRRTDRLDELDSEVALMHHALCRNAAAAGWTVVAVSLGNQGSELSDPRRPLRDLADATAGQVATSGDGLAEALDSLGARSRLSFRIATVDELEPLDVRVAGEPVQAARWAGPVDSRDRALPPTVSDEPGDAVIRLLSPARSPGAEAVRVSAVTGGHDVGYVAFFLDGFLVDVARQPPYSTRVPLADEPQSLRAVAFSSDALELGEDTIRVNELDRPFRVDIADVRGEPARGQVELDATVSTPAGRELERVEFFWNDQLREVVEPPAAGGRLSVRLETSPPAATDHYRVIAHLDDGTSLETARMARQSGAEPDRLDVNLVEIYATVIDRRSGPLSDLNRDDFTLVHSGRRRPLAGFARAQELPLTLGLAVDTSQSMAEWQEDMRRAAATFFENTLGDRDRAFLTDFAARPRLAQPATGDRQLLTGRMGALEFDGYTALYDAVVFSLAQFDGLGGRKALVVLSDGDDSKSRFRPERCIREGRRLGVPVYMVVREDPSRPLDARERMVLGRVSEQTGGRAFFFSSRQRLDEIYAAIEADLRSQYLLTYATARPLTAGDLGDIRVEVSDPRLSVRTFLGGGVH